MLKVLSALLLCLLSVFCLCFKWFNIGLFFSLLSYVLLGYYTLRVTGINSILFLLIVLFGLYGYSVPISVFFEADIGWHRIAKLKTWHKVDDTLFSYLISNQLALLAIIVLYIFFVNRKTMDIQIHGLEKKIIYYRFALVSGYIASCSELLNFIRAGGFSTVSNGKAFYQGAVNDLVLNIPYEGFFYISISLFSMFLASTKKNFRLTYLIRYLPSILFVFFINLIIGERGTLLVSFVIFALGFSINHRIKSIKTKYIFFVSILYILFNVLTLLREKEVKYNGAISFYNENKERLFRLMNPANTEFYASALNYRIFIDRKPENYKYKLGKTYSEVLFAFFPTYIYPNKPKSIIYEFRDDYFPERKKQGSTAGTGFSSLLEAYMNFGYLGAFLVYFIAVFFIIYLESNKKKNNIFIKIIYLLSFNIVLISSRSASQYILFNVILYLFQVSFVVLTYKVIPKKIYRISKIEN
ncbi:oligosaccharide repeat unit polymerase [Aquimarina sp. TRL1]|uniref:O-antigen polymerase n=1 Tax=Aquimarina sp. (strain TRL1) TaxID=2736252 RepID=UPI00158A67E6|nr:O-antigen polymerase [Aquimarina sp. TRL1]QKX04714.1 oligosaccharide repeat unit polymerase [Aquimarina sp. TRL1]